MQVTNTILMIRPINFRRNEQTAVNNYFMEDLEPMGQTINERAQAEFDDFVEVLLGIGVNVIVMEDTMERDTPDAVFPNNWISFHRNGSVGLYPMFAENRRKERREDVLDVLEAQGFRIDHILDYTSAEKDGLFLEATGSIVMDRIQQKAYCALSPRADEDLFIEFCEDLDCFPVVFTAYQSVNEERKPIYHTNVMMCLAEDFAIICLDCIDDKTERKEVVNHLKKDGRKIIAISEDQIRRFAGNMLQVLGADDKRYLVMSSQAYRSLTPDQINEINSYCPIVHSPLDTIETCGGGSARCMMAEVFLPRRMAVGN
ncbi:MAG: arginine deiminase-related protein [Bacteroidota bacterium]